MSYLQNINNNQPLIIQSCNIIDIQKATKTNMAEAKENTVIAFEICKYKQ